jgi:putative spermidine/putrescine transport system ATP-binding protein
VDPGRGTIAIDGQEIRASRGLEAARPGETRAVALRPEIVSLDAAANGNRMRGTVEDVNFLGSIVRIRVRFGENAVSLDTFNNPSATQPRPGQTVTVSFPAEAVLVLEGPGAA